MIETEEQRRWWFATHPEFRSAHKKGRAREERKEEEQSENGIIQLTRRRRQPVTDLEIVPRY